MPPCSWPSPLGRVRWFPALSCLQCRQRVGSVGFPLPCFPGSFDVLRHSGRRCACTAALHLPVLPRSYHAAGVSLTFLPVLLIRIRDPGLGAFLTPGSGIRDVRKSASGSGIRYEQTRIIFLEFSNHFLAFFGDKILKFFDEDPGSGMEKSRIRVALFFSSVSK